ncbi:VOC family protein [Nocardia sp. NPDC024068]|uniref:VOC family protein n=1 Tax=Nocardia sp. NPDC024068 TaxID=3157197 RepID=UPI0033E3315D
MRARDQFHVGIVTTDVEATTAALSATLGYEWGRLIDSTVEVSGPRGPGEFALRCVFSIGEPRLEVVRAIPGTLWEPAPGVGIHHIGYFSDDLAGDMDGLVEHGWQVEATREMSDGSLFFAFLANPAGFRVELVDRRAEPGLRTCWAPMT